MAKVFVSSVFRGMEDFRSAVAAAIESLGHTPILAENFPGSSRSPQVACLAGVREADVVILLLGERYGPKQNLGLSATHEEYREAKERCTVIPFVQGNITFDDDQDAFAAEVRSWNGGHYSASFDGPEDLRKAATAALHRWELSQVAGSPNQSEMLERAIALLPQERQSYGRSSMAIALAGWPVQPVLRPSELEDQKMRRDLLKEALFGEAAVLTTMEGTEILLRDHGLLFRQKQRFFWIDEQGSVLLQLPLQMPDYGLSMIIEKFMREQVSRSLRFASMILDKLDPNERLSHIAIAVSLMEVSHLGWRTRREHEASPNSGTMSMASKAPLASLSPPHRTRAALRLGFATLAEDLLTLLRRAIKGV